MASRKIYDQNRSYMSIMDAAFLNGVSVKCIRRHVDKKILLDGKALSRTPDPDPSEYSEEGGSATSRKVYVYDHLRRPVGVFGSIMAASQSTSVPVYRFRKKMGELVDGLVFSFERLAPIAGTPDRNAHTFARTSMPVALVDAHNYIGATVCVNGTTGRLRQVISGVTFRRNRLSLPDTEVAFGDVRTLEVVELHVFLSARLRAFSESSTRRVSRAIEIAMDIESGELPDGELNVEIHDGNGKLKPNFAHYGPAAVQRHRFLTWLVREFVKINS